MNNPLATVASLLRQDGRRQDLSWDDLVVHRNSAPLPSPFPRDDTLWNRGFDFLVLEAGRPAHFARCRSVDDTRAIRASTIRARLSEDPGLARLVPPTRFVLDGDWLVEISRYVRGTQFQHQVRRLGAGALAADARRILAANRLVATEIVTRIATFQHDQSALDLRDTAQPALQFLGQAGLAPRRTAALEAALLAGGTVPPRAQHGDFWPANVLRGADGGFIVLDFEMFGEEQVPLFDVYHFLRSCLMQRARPQRGRTLLEILAGDRPDARTWRTLVQEEAARDGLSRRQALGAFAYYLVAMTATIRRRNGPESHWGPYWLCLETLADQLASGNGPDEILIGPAMPGRASTRHTAH